MLSCSKPQYCIFTTGERNNDMHILKFTRQTVLVSLSSLRSTTVLFFFFYLICRGQLLAVGSERDEASGQVDQTADLQVRVGAAGGRRADCVPSTHQVAVTPLDTAATKAGKMSPACIAPSE